MQQFSLLNYVTRDEQAAKVAAMMPLIRAAMNRVAKQKGALSRDHIADALTEFSQFPDLRLSRTNGKNAQSVSKASLDKWLQPSDREHAPSLEAVVAFCLITGSIEPLRPIFDTLGVRLMSKDEELVYEFGKATLAEREAKKRKRQLEAML